ncbi:MAG: hypothetical protein M1820_000640 [Bogoriella megaspora]|nr:MAG: hypothetical protein M1820_000640 [Bogoriella megaspora]
MDSDLIQKIRRCPRLVKRHVATSLISIHDYTARAWLNITVPTSRRKKDPSINTTVLLQLTESLPDSEFISLKKILRNRFCMVCELIGSIILKQLQITSQDNPNISKIKVCIGSAFVIPEGEQDENGFVDAWSILSHAIQRGQAFKCVLYVQYHSDWRSPPLRYQSNGHWLPSPELGIQLLFSYQESPTQLNKVETWSTPYIDTQLVRKWMADCENNHGKQCTGFQGILPAGFRLFDVHDLCVVENDGSSSFVALSYTWNNASGGRDSELCQENLIRFQTPGAIDLTKLPDVIANTVKLCKGLGQRYLWVDKLCIIQNDSLSKHEQINAMDSIYGNATLTVVAAVNGKYVTGLPGTPGRPRPPFLCNRTRLFELEGSSIGSNFKTVVNDSVWNTRGWTFQERLLSPRCLYIAEYQVYFSCPQTTLEEEIGQLRVRDALNRFVRFSEPSMLWAYNINSLQAYLTSVSLYTARQLSYEMDVLNAFAGVSNVISKQMKTALFFGLPERHFQQAMLWFSAGCSKPRPGVPHIPSWSWAAWSGRVNFNDLGKYPIRAHDTGTLVRYHIRDPDRGLALLNAEETWFGMSKDFREKSCLDEDKIQSKFMPSASTSASIWKECFHNPWMSISHVRLDPQACILAEKHPGCLVFNTTVASVLLKRSKTRNITHLDPDLDSDSSGLYEGKTAKASSGKVERVSLDLCDKARAKIGHMVVDSQWMREKIDLNIEHCFIVLCAQLLPKSHRKKLLISADNGDTVPVFGPFMPLAFVDYESDRAGSVWLLRVMLIERQRGVSRRLGLGYVETRLWNKVEPRWETMVLA